MHKASLNMLSVRSNKKAAKGTNIKPHQTKRKLKIATSTPQPLTSPHRTLVTTPTITRSTSLSAHTRTARLLSTPNLAPFHSLTTHPSLISPSKNTRTTGTFPSHSPAFNIKARLSPSIPLLPKTTTRLLASNRSPKRLFSAVTATSTPPDDSNPALLLPTKYPNALFDFTHEIALTMPKAAWTASVEQFKAAYAVEKVIELLSDIDTANTPETTEKIRKLLVASPELLSEPPFDLIKLQKNMSRLDITRYYMTRLLDLRFEYDSLVVLRKEAFDEFETATRENLKDDIEEWQSVMAQTDNDLFQLKKDFPLEEEKLLQAVLPQDEADARNAVLEVRPGTGGDEAALFAAEMYHMYEKFCQNNGMRFHHDHIQAFDAVGSRGYKEAIATISGENVFGFLKHETGVHRVQRIPDTESGGRIHTSTVTIAVMPEATEVDVEIKESDLRIDLFRASGAGGQHVNTTDSAVRITHIPTGVVVQNQDERSQPKNKEKALKYLRTRLLDMQRQAIAEERARLKGSQVGTGDRNERIRTYNFPQDRVTDHRVNVTLSNIDGFMLGEEGLLQVQQRLSLQERLDMLQESLQDSNSPQPDKPTKGKRGKH